MEEEDELIFDLEKHGISLRSAKDFWTGEDFAVENGKIKKILKPRSCLLVELK
jgi:uncharacterized DUF497 family protein